MPPTCSPARPERRTPEYMARLRQTFGLDQPVHVQLGVYLKNILALDLGYSFRTASRCCR